MEAVIFPKLLIALWLGGCVLSLPVGHVEVVRRDKAQAVTVRRLDRPVKQDGIQDRRRRHAQNRLEDEPVVDPAIVPHLHDVGGRLLFRSWSPCEEVWFPRGGPPDEAELAGLGGGRQAVAGEGAARRG